MKREIKFRGKSTETNEWLYGDLVEYPQGEFQIWTKIREDGGHNFMVIPETVGQFTGLYDKNGKDIYEGDIVKDEYESFDIYGEVVYEHGKWIAKNDDDAVYSELSDFYKGVEVVGNIHDNPELLTTNH